MYKSTVSEIPKRDINILAVQLSRICLPVPEFIVFHYPTQRPLSIPFSLLSFVVSFISRQFILAPANYGKDAGVTYSNARSPLRLTAYIFFRCTLIRYISFNSLHEIIEYGISRSICAMFLASVGYHGQTLTPGSLVIF